MIVIQQTGLYGGCLCIKEPYYLYLKKDKGLQVNDTKNIFKTDQQSTVRLTEKIGRQSGLLKYEFSSPR